jgi:hypothetical protein
MSVRSTALFCRNCTGRERLGIIAAAFDAEGHRSGGGKTWAPVIVPSVIVALMVLLAVLVGGRVWMTAALVVGLIALMFAESPLPINFRSDAIASRFAAPPLHRTAPRADG